MPSMTIRSNGDATVVTTHTWDALAEIAAHYIDRYEGDRAFSIDPIVDPGGQDHTDRILTKAKEYGNPHDLIVDAQILIDRVIAGAAAALACLQSGQGLAGAYVEHLPLDLEANGPAPWGVTVKGWPTEDYRLRVELDWDPNYDGEGFSTVVAEVMALLRAGEVGEAQAKAASMVGSAVARAVREVREVLAKLG